MGHSKLYVSRVVVGGVYDQLAVVIAKCEYVSEVLYNTFAYSTIS